MAALLVFIPALLTSHVQAASCESALANELSDTINQISDRLDPAVAEVFRDERLFNQPLRITFYYTAIFAHRFGRDKLRAEGIETRWSGFKQSSDNPGQGLGFIEAFGLPLQILKSLQRDPNIKLVRMTAKPTRFDRLLAWILKQPI